MKALLFALLLVVSATAQTLTPSLSAASVATGKPVTLTVTYAAGTNPAAAIQWSLAVPTGTTVVWAGTPGDTTLNKSLTCNATASPQVCILAGLNDTAIPSGPLATATITFPAGTRGTQTLTLSSDLAASLAGDSIAVAGASATEAALSPFDLNGDGSVNNADLLIAIGQALGINPCTTADFNGDGVCNVDDLVLLAVDSAATTP